LPALHWPTTKLLKESVSMLVTIMMAFIVAATISVASTVAVEAAVFVAPVNFRDLTVVIAVTGTSAFTVAVFAFVAFLITERVVCGPIIARFKNFGYCARIVISGPNVKEIDVFHSKLIPPDVKFLCFYYFLSMRYS